MVRIQGYKVVVKPALFVLVGACITGAIALPILKKMPEKVQVAPSSGYLPPNRWRFEVVKGAEAALNDISDKPLQAMQVGDHGLFQIDMESGVAVTVTKTTGPANVFLRNGFNLADMKTLTDLVLRFEARSKNAFTVLLIIRDDHTLVWSQNIRVEGDWKKYEIPLPLTALSARTKPMMVFAVQLGAQTGDVGLRHIELKEQDQTGK